MQLARRPTELGPCACLVLRFIAFYMLRHSKQRCAHYQIWAVVGAFSLEFLVAGHQ